MASTERSALCSLVHSKAKFTRSCTLGPDRPFSVLPSVQGCPPDGILAAFLTFSCVFTHSFEVPLRPVSSVDFSRDATASPHNLGEGGAEPTEHF